MNLINQQITGSCFKRELKEHLDVNNWRGRKTDADLYSKEYYDKQRPVISPDVQFGGLIEISLPNYKLKYKDNYLPIISATYYDTGKQWVLKLSDVGGNIVNVTIIDSKTYDILSSDEIECGSGGKGRRKRTNKSMKKRKNKSRKNYKNKSRRK